MLEKPYIIRGNNWAGGSVVKINYGRKFVIAKCKTQAGSLKNIEDDLNAFIRGGRNNPGSIYTHLYDYVKAHPGQDFHVETILESDSPYELLRKEQQLLDDNRRNKNFLNNQVDAYIPAYNDSTQMYGWIPKSAVLNFQKWLRNR